MPNPYIHAIAHTIQGGDPLQIDVSQVNGAVATDDPRLGAGGGGDMLKSVYDTDNDGIVDNTETLLGLVPPATGNAGTTQIVLGSDTRLADSRNPLAHAPSHNLGGSDPVAPDWTQIANKPTTFAPVPHEASHVTGADQIPTAGTSGKGLMAQANGSAVQFYGSDGTQKAVPYSAVTGTPVLPSPIGDMTKAVYDIGNSGIVDNAEALLGHVTPASGNATATQVVLGSDTRLADNRTPLPHESTHLVGGSDPIALVTTAAAGLCVPPDGTTIQITGGKLVSTGGAGGGASSPVILGETAADAYFSGGIIVPRYGNHPDRIWTPMGPFDDHFDAGSINAKWVQTLTSGILNPVYTQNGSKLCTGGQGVGTATYSNIVRQQLPVQATHQITFKVYFLGYCGTGTLISAGLIFGLEYSAGNGIECNFTNFIPSGGGNSNRFYGSYGAGFGTNTTVFLTDRCPLYFQVTYDASKVTTASVSNDGVIWMPVFTATGANTGFATNAPVQWFMGIQIDHTSVAFAQFDWIKHV